MDLRIPNRTGSTCLECFTSLQVRTSCPVVVRHPSLCVLRAVGSQLELLAMQCCPGDVHGVESNLQVAPLCCAQMLVALSACWGSGVQTFISPMHASHTSQAGAQCPGQQAGPTTADIMCSGSLPAACCWLSDAPGARQGSELQTSLCTETLPAGWCREELKTFARPLARSACDASGPGPQPTPLCPRLQVRDAQGARQDLDNQGLAYKRRELQASMTGQPRPSPFGALVFTCNGRGRHLYGEPHWDSRRLADFVPVPSSGFFCNGGCGCHAPARAR